MKIFMNFKGNDGLGGTFAGKVDSILIQNAKENNNFVTISINNKEMYFKNAFYLDIDDEVIMNTMADVSKEATNAEEEILTTRIEKIENNPSDTVSWKNVKESLKQKIEDNKIF